MKKHLYHLIMATPERFLADFERVEIERKAEEIKIRINRDGLSFDKRIAYYKLEIELLKRQQSTPNNEYLHKLLNEEVFRIKQEKRQNKLKPESQSTQSTRFLKGQKKRKTKSGLTINQIALIHVYNKTPITRGDSANRIAADEGHTSGDALYNKYTHWMTATNRTGEEDSDLKTQNKINLIESIIERLSKEGHYKASAEIKTLKSKLPKK